MKILKDGDKKKLLKTKEFNCKECGCVFEADKTEYHSGIQYNEEYYYCKCPCCEATVYSD